MTTDSAIIRDSLTEPERFATLYDRHARRLYRFLAARLGTHAAEDVLSETFLAAFRGRARFDLTVEDSGPWLFGIATRLASRHRRLEARHLAADDASGPVEIYDPTRATEDAVDAARAVAAMRSRLSRLHQRDRDVLLLYAWADLSYEQIAAALEIPIGTVRSRLNRARRPDHRHDRRDRTRRVLTRAARGMPAGTIESFTAITTTVDHAAPDL